MVADRLPGSGILANMNDNVDLAALQARVPQLLRLCRRAGEAICAHYAAPAAGEYEVKGDNSPLTLADLASHAIVRDGLIKLDPGIPLLSEESSPAETAGRRQWTRCWMVDPLDGTKGFLARNGEFTINIALVDQHRPVLGVLYLPLENVAYVGIPGALARRYSLSGEDDWTPDDLATRPLEDSRALEVLVSRRRRSRRLQACLDWLDEHRGPASLQNLSSALKFCRLAAGRGDIYPCFVPCNEWDIAAGQALVEAAGGAVLGLDGRPLRYNCRESLLSPHFYALADPAHALWQRLLRAGPVQP